MSEEVTLLRVFGTENAMAHEINLENADLGQIMLIVSQLEILKLKLVQSLIDSEEQ